MPFEQSDYRKMSRYESFKSQIARDATRVRENDIIIAKNLHPVISSGLLSPLGENLDDDRRKLRIWGNGRNEKDEPSMRKHCGEARNN
jgi:hypothetical protein